MVSKKHHFQDEKQTAYIAIILLRRRRARPNDQILCWKEHPRSWDIQCPLPQHSGYSTISHLQILGRFLLGTSMSAPPEKHRSTSVVLADVRAGRCTVMSLVVKNNSITFPWERLLSWNILFLSFPFRTLGGRDYCSAAACHRIYTTSPGGKEGINDSSTYFISVDEKMHNKIKKKK